ncbi:MAG TPA: glycosyltransferase family 4 protein [Actinophytocola sp.]|uniref:glycosyltransferase family 4 protein n=1 Tax=Actinophytocola sp. TaxID=1872138 RepID=UPI002DDCE999|nr:glycosyltransferase family 4 protein [Actinophytocola sp.]HEV2780599.1 glycosyltransferase family 4 protein [Actinophytocola sp.]
MSPWLAAVAGPARSTAGGMSVSGWVAGPGPRPALSATLGGRPAEVRIDEPYPDTVPGLPPDWPVWGWTVSGARAGEQVTVELSTRDGRLLARRDVRPDGAPVPAARGGVDNPVPDAVVAGDLVAVTGWLLLDDELPGRVEVAIGGGRPVDARLMIPRPDLAASVPDVPDAVMAGFEARLPVELSPGESRRVTVRVRGWSRDGRVWIAPPRECTVRLRAADPEELATGRRAIGVTRSLLAVTPPAPDPRHVLVLAHSLRIGGGELWLAELLGRLVRDHGLRITVVAQTDGALRPELEALGITVRLTGYRRIQDAAPYESHVTELSLLMRASGAGCVLVNTLGLFPGVDAALRAGLPVAWAIHESFALADFAYLNWGPDGLAPVVRQRWRHCLAAASALVFVADATREMFLPHAPARRCLTVRYGIDPGVLPAAEPVAVQRNRLGIPADATVLLTVGVTEPRKGHGPLLAAFDRARRRHADAHLVIVGVYDCPYGDALRDFVARRGLAGRVRLLPIVRDPLPWFRIADLFVNCSDIESLPRTILEAMALRVPVLATDVFGARELITDGESGWLMRPNDLTALTAGLLRALDTPAAERARLADRAHAHVEPFLDSAGYGAELAKILGNLAGTVEGRNG